MTHRNINIATDGELAHRGRTLPNCQPVTIVFVEHNHFDTLRRLAFFGLLQKTAGVQA